MKSFIQFPFHIAMVSLAFLDLSAASSAVLSVHGSGSTFAGMCLRSVMDEMEARSKVPVRMTYRGTGSTTGLKEFLNEFDPSASAMDFGVGDFSLTAEQHETFQNTNATAIQLPLLFGALSFFYNIPGVDNLNLTSCVLGRIFTRDITDWAHPDIRELNPGFDKIFNQQDSLGASLRIRVARRGDGSGSTQAVTQYLNKACPRVFPEEMASDMPEWPEDTEVCFGSTGMEDCIAQRAGTIGYLTAGAGLRRGLQEIALKNKYGRHVTSQTAAANGGIGVQGDDTLPESPTDDMSSVSVLDQDGEWTWPLTVISYMYIRTDLSFIKDPIERSLLVAFVKAMYIPEFTEKCSQRYGFELPSGPAMRLGGTAIDLLEANLGKDSLPWTFETKDVEAFVGAGDYVLSATRENYRAWERDAANLEVTAMQETIAVLQQELSELKTAGTSQTTGFSELNYNKEEESKVMASLILSSISAVLGLALLVLFAVRGKEDKEEKNEDEKV